MRPARNFLRLSARDRLFLVKCTGLVGLIRLGLWLLPFRTLRRRLDSLPRPSGRAQTPAQRLVNRAVWGVTTSSRCIPAATCLTQALAARLLLSWWGCPAELRIGVLKDDHQTLQAHAWVERDGLIVIGGSDSPLRYTPLPPLEGKKP